MDTPTTPADVQDPPRNEITRLLARWREGEELARDELLTCVYDHARRIARHQLGRIRGDALQQPTELAHELMLKLLEADVPWENRRHFYGVLLVAMRRLVIDAARARNNQRRGGGAVHLPLSAADRVPIAGGGNGAERLTEALDVLRAHDARKSDVVEMTYLLGLTREEIAQALRISVPTVDRDLRYARAWLRAHLGD